MVEGGEGEDRLPLLVDDQVAAVADGGDEGEAAPLELLLAGHQRERGVVGVADGLGRLHVGGLQPVFQPLAIGVEEGIVALRIVALHAREVLVRGGGESLARDLLVGRGGRQPFRRRLAQGLVARRAGGIADDLAFHLGDPAAVGLQPQIQDRALAGLLYGGDHRRLAGRRIGEDVPVFAQTRDAGPGSFAQAQRLVVLGEGQGLGRRQLAGIVRGQGLEVAVDDPLQTGAVAGRLVGGAGRRRDRAEHRREGQRHPNRLGRTHVPSPIAPRQAKQRKSQGAAMLWPANSGRASV